MKKSRNTDGIELTEGTFWLRQTTASATECTGLTPSAVLDDDESYVRHPSPAGAPRIAETKIPRFSRGIFVLRHRNQSARPALYAS